MSNEDTSREKLMPNRREIITSCANLSELRGVPVWCIAPDFFENILLQTGATLELYRIGDEYEATIFGSSMWSGTVCKFRYVAKHRGMNEAINSAFQHHLTACA